ncbi:MAG TPA: T9SS type A sorting domain-containing protein [Caldithrix abyssi]|uniref:N-acetylmuramoyl-L-alanine amidase n=1 Tax=Caldithrix abyssi TaxID=187145 RepID=A0A7V4U080_CALAY|nr:T9SS type A sorting domain-containing protein [Caldithrix abyssi]
MMKSINISYFLLIAANLFFVSNVNAQIQGLSGWNIYLDPGHSQKENMGIYNYSEAEKNLGVGLALRQMLLSETDIDTAYICRTNDQQYVSLSQRTDQANSLGAAWYHSIHSDAGSADRNSTLLLWGQYYNGDEKNPKGGKALSDIMINLLTNGMRISTRGSIGDCSFYTWSDYCATSGGPYLHVNRTTNMPSELSEAGYHTNPTQNTLNMNADWKRLEARTMFWSILDLHGIDRPPVRIASGIVKNKEGGKPINGAQITIDGQTYITDTYESLFYKYSNDPDQLSNGFYYIEDVEPVNDSITIIVSAENFYPDTATIAVRDDFFTFKDFYLVSTIPPTIVSTTPVQGDTAFSVLNDITIKFSRPMNEESVDTSLVIEPMFAHKLVWKNSSRELYIRTDSLLFETEYTITIPGHVSDKYGHLLDANGDGAPGDTFQLSFRTGHDQIPPEIIAKYPAENQQQVEREPIISIRYNERIDSASVTEDVFKLERFTDKSIVPVDLLQYDVGDETVINVVPQAGLFADNIYIMRIYPGLKDLLGNEVSDYNSITFRTGEYNFVGSVIDNFEGGTGNWWQPSQSGSTTGHTEDTKMFTATDITNVLTQSTKAMKLDYGWDGNAEQWLIREYLSGGAPRSVQFDKNNILQVYVFGDGSGNQFRFAVDDRLPATSGSYHEVSPWITIDWIGWKLVSWDMVNDGTGEWLGDGNLDGTLRIDSFQLTHVAGASLTGTIYFDDLRVVKKEAVPVAITEKDQSVPVQYELSQNFPNPFNPVTQIRFALPKREQVQIDVYNILGEHVRTLVNEVRNAGRYSIRFDGTHLPSGVYIYTMRAGAYHQTGKMILTK